MPPPKVNAVLPVTVLSIRVTVPKLKMPPPLATPLVMMSVFSVTLAVSRARRQGRAGPLRYCATASRRAGQGLAILRSAFPGHGRGSRSAAGRPAPSCTRTARPPASGTRQACLSVSQQELPGTAAPQRLLAAALALTRSLRRSLARARRSEADVHLLLFAACFDDE